MALIVADAIAVCQIPRHTLRPVVVYKEEKGAAHRVENSGRKGAQTHSPRYQPGQILNAKAIAETEEPEKNKTDLSVQRSSRAAQIQGQQRDRSEEKIRAEASNELVQPSPFRRDVAKLKCEIGNAPMTGIAAVSKNVLQHRPRTL